MNLPSRTKTLWEILMAMIMRITGGLLLVYSALYTAHFIFDTLYDARPVWTVLNVIAAVGILIALAVNFVHVRPQSCRQAVTVSSLGAYRGHIAS